MSMEDARVEAATLKLAAYLGVCPPSRWRMLNAAGEKTIGKEAAIDPEDVFDAYLQLTASGIFFETRESRFHDGNRFFMRQWVSDMPPPASDHHRSGSIHRKPLQWGDSLTKKRTGT